MSEIVTMDRDMLTEVMAQAMMRANQQRFGLPSRAAGEQSNIANRTEYYGLPLPTGNEVIAYQDFINDANNIIDGALHSLQNTLDTVSTTANNAADGVAAADTKIQELVQANLDNESASLPQFKQDTNARLENLEDDVNGMISWIYPFLAQSSGASTSEICISSIGFSFIGRTFSLTESYTEPMVAFHSGTNRTFSSPKRHKAYKVGGNYFNLPLLNTYYIEPVAAYNSEKNYATYYFGVLWTGTETRIDFLIDSASDNTIINAPSCIVPITTGRYKVSALS